MPSPQKKSGTSCVFVMAHCFPAGNDAGLKLWFYQIVFGHQYDTDDSRFPGQVGRAYLCVVVANTDTMLELPRLDVA
ncbi:MAG: hypothetical protein QM610_08005 [Chitinophagaceae bacterium]